MGSLYGDSWALSAAGDSSGLGRPQSFLRCSPSARPPVAGHHVTSVWAPAGRNSPCLRHAVTMAEGKGKEPHHGLITPLLRTGIQLFVRI